MLGVVELQNVPQSQNGPETFCVRDILWQLAATKCLLTQNVPKQIFYGWQFAFLGHFGEASCHPMSPKRKRSSSVLHHYFLHWYFSSSPKFESQCLQILLPSNQSTGWSIVILWSVNRDFIQYLWISKIRIIGINQWLRICIIQIFDIEKHFRYWKIIIFMDIH